MKRSRSAPGARDRGASAVEYGLLVAAIAAVIVGVLFGLSGVLTDSMHDVCQNMEAHNADTVQDSEAC